MAFTIDPWSISGGRAMNEFEYHMDRMKRELYERLRRDQEMMLQMTIQRVPSPRSMHVEESVPKAKCKSCGEDRHGGSVDMIGYCENRLKQYHLNLRKILNTERITTI